MKLVTDCGCVLYWNNYDKRVTGWTLCEKHLAATKEALPNE